MATSPFSAADLFLFNEGTHVRLYEKLVRILANLTYPTRAADLLPAAPISPFGRPTPLAFPSSAISMVGRRIAIH